MKKNNCLTEYVSPVKNDNIGHKVCKMLLFALILFCYGLNTL